MTTTTAVRTAFGERSTASKIAAGVDLSDRTAIVTGASSGIGVETARVLADHGAAVTLAVRDAAAGESVAASIRTSTRNDPTFAFVPYSPFLGYGQSKTANVLSAIEGNRRWERDAITVNAVMPGGIATRVQRHVDPEALARARREAGASAALKTIEQGAATSILAAVSPLLDGVGGRYLEDCNEAQIVRSRADSGGRHGVAAYALDSANAERLWGLSEERLAS